MVAQLCSGVAPGTAVGLGWIFQWGQDMLYKIINHPPEKTPPNKSGKAIWSKIGNSYFFTFVKVIFVFLKKEIGKKKLPISICF